MPGSRKREQKAQLLKFQCLQRCLNDTPKAAKAGKTLEIPDEETIVKPCRASGLDCPSTSTAQLRARCDKTFLETLVQKERTPTCTGQTSTLNEVFSIVMLLSK